jgi:hypothetical protein
MLTPTTEGRSLECHHYRLYEKHHRPAVECVYVSGSGRGGRERERARARERESISGSTGLSRPQMEWLQCTGSAWPCVGGLVDVRVCVYVYVWVVRRLPLQVSVLVVASH